MQVVVRIILLIAILGGLNVIYDRTLYQKDLAEKYPEALQLAASDGSTDVYYFGESSNVTYHANDSTTESISALTSRFYPSLRFTNVNKYATHAGIYRAWLHEIDSMPRAVVVTMNLRSFDAAWIHSRLENALQEGLVLRWPYPHLVDRFLLSLQAFDSKTPAEREAAMLEEWKRPTLAFPYRFPFKSVQAWDNAMAQGGYLLPDGSWDTKKIELACHYIKGYAFNINGDNPRVSDFDEIVTWGRKNRVHLYFNLLAENLSYADSLVGGELVFLMRRNRDYLVRRYQSADVTVVDNLEALAGKEFIDQTWTTEHYFASGRLRIASNLADSMKRQFRSSYRKAY